MTLLLTLRLEQKTRQRIARIASRRRISTSEVIREAIEAWVEKQEPIAAPYEAMADLIGGRCGRSIPQEMCRRLEGVARTPGHCLASRDASDVLAS